MLRRLNVRTRLIAVIAVPLVLLLAVAIPEALQRRERAADARQAAAASDDVVVVAAAINALQGERTISAVLRAGAPEDLAQSVEDQRSLVDATLAPADDALGRLGRLGGDGQGGGDVGIGVRGRHVPDVARRRLGVHAA